MGTNTFSREEKWRASNTAVSLATQKNYPTGITPRPWGRDKPLATIPSVGNPLITGPARTVLGQKFKQAFPTFPPKIVESFMTRFSGQSDRPHPITREPILETGSDIAIAVDQGVKAPETVLSNKRTFLNPTMSVDMFGFLKSVKVNIDTGVKQRVSKARRTLMNLLER